MRIGIQLSYSSGDFREAAQEIVVKDGYYPLPAKIVAEENAKLK